MNEGKQLAAAIQAEIVRAQAAILGERFRCCEHCGAKRWSKDCYPATFHSAFRNVPVKIRRLSASRCRSGSQEAKSFAEMLAAGVIAPLAHVTGKLAALAPFAECGPAPISWTGECLGL